MNMNTTTRPCYLIRERQSPQCCIMLNPHTGHRLLTGHTAHSSNATMPRMMTHCMLDMFTRHSDRYPEYTRSDETSPAQHQNNNHHPCQDASRHPSVHHCFMACMMTRGGLAAGTPAARTLLSDHMGGAARVAGRPHLTSE